MTPKEALELLKRKAHTYDDEYCLPRMDCKKELDDKTEEAYQRLLNALTGLEELIKRDAGMKLTQASRFTTDKKLYGMYACNSCHQVIPYITLNSKRLKPKFCYHCGQRLDWEELNNGNN